MFQAFQLSSFLPHRSDSSKSELTLVDTSSSTSEVLPLLEASCKPIQDQHSNGLLATADYDLAIQRCKVKVKRIAAECRARNRRFRDIEFDLLEDRELVLHSLDKQGTHEPNDPRRVPDIFYKPTFFANEDDSITNSAFAPGPSCDVAPGHEKRGGVASGAGGLIERICVARDEEVGVYGFIFWKDSGWRDIIIDDLLYLRTARWEELSSKDQAMWHKDVEKYRNTARKGNKALYFARSTRENETWVSLLEKAYAKLCGDYTSLDKIWSSDVVVSLTGAIAFWIPLIDVLDVDKLWEDELSHSGEDRLFSVTIRPSVSTDAYRADTGLVVDAYYYILKAITVEKKQFLLMRNPWGNTYNEWNGRWSDGSPQWTTEWLERLGKGEFGGHQFGRKGHFLMEYSDFLNTWDSLDKYRIFDSSWSLSQLWLHVDLGGHPKAWDYGDVSYTFTLPSSSPTVIALFFLISNEVDCALSNKYFYAVDFAVYKRGGREPVACSDHTGIWMTDLNVEVDLEAGEYVVHVRVDREARPPPVVPPPPPPPPIHGMPPSRIPSPPPLKSPFDTMSRKYGRTRTSISLGASVAQNFEALDYTTSLPLPIGTFTGKDLTEMELEVHQRWLDHKEAVREAYHPAPTPRARSPVVKSERDSTEQDGPRSTVGDDGDARVGLDTQESNAEEPAPQEDDRASIHSVASTELGVDLFEDALDTLEPEASLLKTERVQRELPVMFQPDFEVENDQTEVDVADAAKPPESAPSTLSSSPQPPRGRQRSSVSSVRASVSRDRSRSRSAGRTVSPGPIWGSGYPPPPPPPPPEQFFFCNGCDGPRSGVRYKCLHYACFIYILCERCHKMAIHPPDHKFMKIPTQDDAMHLMDVEDGKEENKIVMGLKVYSHKDSPATVSGQLRHGNVLRKGLAMRLTI